MMWLVGLMRGVRPVWILCGALAAAVVGYIVFQNVANIRLERALEAREVELKLLEADVAIHHAKVSELLLAVSEQSAEVERLAGDTERVKQEAVEVAMRVSRDRVRRISEIAELAKADGTSCQDGVALIDLELRL